MTSPFPGMDPYLEDKTIWPVTLDNALPLLPVPLIAPDPDVPLDLNAAIGSIYQRAGYAWRLDYEQPVPPPALRPAMTSWLERHGEQ